MSGQALGDDGSIHLAQTDLEIQSCFAVMSQLRPHLEASDFVARIRRQQQDGFQMAFLETGDGVQAVAGFRMVEMLAHGRFLYVDDLITDRNSRSRGHGEALLDWLCELARAHDCQSLQLDSGVQRFDAHRFYFRQRMTIASYHFALKCECR